MPGIPLIVRMALAPGGAGAARVFVASARIPAAIAELVAVSELLDPATRRAAAQRMSDIYCGEHVDDDLCRGLHMLAGRDPAAVKTWIEAGIAEIAVAARAWRPDDA